MRHRSTKYHLYKDGEDHVFMSEKEACKYIGVRQGYVSYCCYRGFRPKGYNVEKLGPANHGQSKTRIFTIWNCMIQRCNNPKHKFYKNYGGRGIRVCDEWQGENGCLNFINWANSNGYSDDLSIDRINNDGNYEPGNCRFVTQLDQGANMSNTKKVFINGEYLSIGQCAKKYNIPKGTIGSRLRYGLDPLTGERKENETEN